MDLITIAEQIEKAIMYFEGNYLELATLKANYEQKDDYKKTQLAICEMMSTGKTQAEITREALASPEYKEFLQELALARLEYYKKNSEYEAKRAAFEGLRSLNKNLQ